MTTFDRIAALTLATTAAVSLAGFVAVWVLDRRACSWALVTGESA